MVKALTPQSNGEPDGKSNADFAWDSFSSDAYNSDNYGKLQEEDREILQIVGSFFAAAFAGRPKVGCAIDVGSGSNLYPALLMLPWAEQIQLTDYSAANVEWLRDQVADTGDGPWAWQPFWDELHRLEGYNRIAAPRKQLREAHVGEVAQQSVFDLPPRKWQLGTMFFVAESITCLAEEFRTAVGRFNGALKPGAPFAIAFMEGSPGYAVGGTVFPAVRVRKAEVERCLTELRVSELTVTKVENPPLVRHGYEGMIVATGLASGRDGTPGGRQ
jgi:hypothetical protein